MKYAAVVLFNNKNSILSVNYTPVTDTFLAGGVFLDEVIFIPYDAPSRVAATLSRLEDEFDGIFLICDRVLLLSARDAIEVAAGTRFTEEHVLETADRLYALIPAGMEGAMLVRYSIVPRIDTRRKRRYNRVVVCTATAPTQALREAMIAAAAVAQGKLSLHASEKHGIARIEVIYDDLTPKMISDEVVRILATELKDYVYSLEDKTISERLFDALKVHRMRISTAESFTAGGVGQAIVKNPGASEVFVEGLNTYSNKSKTERLGVSEYTLKSKGAVSDQTVYEMAAGLIKQGNCDVAIATSGVAGPSPDGDKAVGICYIAVGTREKVRVFRFHLQGDRETITTTAVNYAHFLAYREIK